MLAFEAANRLAVGGVFPRVSGGVGDLRHVESVAVEHSEEGPK